MAKVNDNFRDRVYAVVSQIPKGRVMTYGQIAALCGSPRAARIVGGIAHLAPCAHQSDFDCDCSPHRSDSTPRSAVRQQSDSCTTCSARGAPIEPSEPVDNLCPMHELPWQRVVKKDGSLAEGYPGGVAGHQQVLEAEGVKICDSGKVNVAELIWSPGVIIERAAHIQKHTK